MQQKPRTTKILIAVIIVLVILVSILIGIIIAEPLTADLSDYKLELQIGNDTYQIDCANSDITYELREAACHVPMDIKFNDEKGINLKINGEKIEDGGSLTIDRLSKDEYITLEVSTLFDSVSFSFRTLPQEFPEMTLEGSYETDKDIYGTTLKNEQILNHYAFKMSMDGELLYFNQNTSETLDFKKVELDEGTFYTYAVVSPTENQELNDARAFNYVYLLLDENFNFVRTYGKLPTALNGYGTEFLDGHDIIFLGMEHYITVTYLPVMVNDEIRETYNIPEGNIFTSYLQEVKDGEVVWEWLGSDHEQFFDYYTQEEPASGYHTNYMLLNGMSIDPNDGNLIVSMKMQDAVAKIDRSTGDILWTLGGVHDDFNLSEEQMLYQQHYPLMKDNDTLMVFDNSATEFSRIALFDLDEENMVLEKYQSYDIGTRTNQCGSVEWETDEIYVIGHGNHEDTTVMMSVDDIESGQRLLTLSSEHPLGTYRMILN